MEIYDKKVTEIGKYDEKCDQNMSFGKLTQNDQNGSYDKHMWIYDEKCGRNIK